MEGVGVLTQGLEHLGEGNRDEHESGVAQPQRHGKQQGDWHKALHVPAARITRMCTTNFDTQRNHSQAKRRILIFEKQAGTQGEKWALQGDLSSASMAADSILRFCLSITILELCTSTKCGGRLQCQEHGGCILDFSWKNL
jgi:hypothetical protein